MKLTSLLLSLVLVLAQSYGFAKTMRCESRALSAAAKNQKVTDLTDFEEDYEVVESSSKTQEGVIKETYVFQKSDEEGNVLATVKIAAEAVKVLGKLKCSVKVVKD